MKSRWQHLVFWGIWFRALGDLAFLSRRNREHRQGRWCFWIRQFSLDVLLFQEPSPKSAFIHFLWLWAHRCYSRKREKLFFSCWVYVKPRISGQKLLERLKWSHRLMVPFLVFPAPPKSKRVAQTTWIPHIRFRLLNDLSLIFKMLFSDDNWQWSKIVTCKIVKFL